MSAPITFDQFELKKSVIQAVSNLGYESPTPVQAESIPPLLEGRDIIAQAQTGTGKTAAFALPALTRIKSDSKNTQALVLAPTRELAIQVAEAFQSYAKGMKDFHVTPIYGGQDYQPQLRALKRGSQVVVGTPGRVMDHLRRGTLKVDQLDLLILDEADEMLNMGFVDDIEWILEQIPGEHQTALFSATMPSAIKNIAKKYLTDPVKIHLKDKESSAKLIEQSYALVPQSKKLNLLTCYLEAEKMEASIIFTHTKTLSAELAEKLQARGHLASALNGDMNQTARKNVVDRLKKGTLDIVVATDVAARGIDVSRVSHVINYDIPYDTQSYIHRIGRTGRAGKKGKAVLFVTPREQRLFRDIMRVTNNEMQPLKPPSLDEMNLKRSQELLEKVTTLHAKKSLNLSHTESMVQYVLDNSDLSLEEITTALAYLIKKPAPIVTFNDVEFSQGGGSGRNQGRGRGNQSNRSQRRPGDRRSESGDKPKRKRRFDKDEEQGQRGDRRKSFGKKSDGEKSFKDKAFPKKVRKTEKPKSAKPDSKNRLTLKKKKIKPSK